MYLSEEKSLMILRLLLEGNSIRSIERITGVEKKTITRVLLKAGEHCEQLIHGRSKALQLRTLKRTKYGALLVVKIVTSFNKGITDPKLGDAYTFVGIERNTKLVLAWHLGERGMQDTEAFTEKLNEATSGYFQLTTDGFRPYENVSATHSEPALTMRC
jgi:hypothetical protein